VALLTNILPPYRVPFFNELARRVDLHVIVNALSTPDRSWTVDPAQLRFALRVEGGLTRANRRRGAAGITETRFQHLAQRTVPILRDLAPDIVVSAELGLRTAQAAWYARRRGIPCVLFWEGTAHTEAGISPARRLWRQTLLRGIDAAWVNGVESRDYLRSLGVAEPAISTDMTGVDTEYFRDSARAARAGRDERRAAFGLTGTVLAVSGSLTARKGTREFLQALERLLARPLPGPCSVLFIGDGEERGRVEAWARANRGMAVHVTGFRQLADLPSLYACADWCILPTLEDCWALATVEPMACGLPQVFSRYNGASADLIRYPGAGLLADPLDPEGFAEVLRAAIQTGPSPLANGVVEAVCTRYGSRALADRAARAIRQTLARRGFHQAA